MIAQALNVDMVGQGTREERTRPHQPDVRDAACPVIALLHTDDPAFVSEAAKRGIFAYITNGEGTEMQSAIDIVLRRFADYHSLEGAFG